ncbi:MAG: hypothetical protein WC325_08015 [Candidatus Bathyarchaeia archaeon]
MRMPKKQVFGCSNFYVCQNCGYELPKEQATVSGWDAQQSNCHVHCPKCGKIIRNIP